MVLRYFRKVVNTVGIFRYIRMTEAVNPETMDATKAELRIASVETSESHKRNLELVQDEKNESEAKKVKVETGEAKREGPYKKKKVALMMVYNGKNYLGMQRNPGVPTIERDLIQALVKAGVITQDHADSLEKINFQRAARTDKTVSAAGQVCSLKMFIDVEDPVEKINSHLPQDIKVLSIKQVTKGFCCKNAASARTYLYLIPTFAFAPCTEIITENYRITDEVRDKVNKVLDMFLGTHNFHNFTSGKKPTDPSARRYIMKMSMGEPFMKEGIEFAVISVKGQSFMLHQIRKMIGITIAIVQGLTNEDTIQLCWGPEKVDVPKAPGLGLMLDRLHYDWYNKKYGNDGIHEKLEWDECKKEIDQFKEEVIFKTMVDTEKQEKSMMTWLPSLLYHKYQGNEDGADLKSSGVRLAAENLKEVIQQKKEEENPSDDVKQQGTGCERIDTVVNVDTSSNIGENVVVSDKCQETDGKDCHVESDDSNIKQ